MWKRRSRGKFVTRKSMDKREARWLPWMTSNFTPDGFGDDKVEITENPTAIFQEGSSRILDSVGEVIPALSKDMRLTGLEGPFGRRGLPIFMSALDDTSSLLGSANVAEIWYWWLRVKLDAATYGGGGGTLTLSANNPAPDANLQNILARNDVLKWGMVPVFGPMADLGMILDMADATFPVASNVPTGAFSVTQQSSGGSINQGPVGPSNGQNPAPRYGGRYSVIPFPRLPRGGLHLSGEMLVCIATKRTAFQATDEFLSESSGNERHVWVERIGRSRVILNK